MDQLRQGESPSTFQRINKRRPIELQSKDQFLRRQLNKKHSSTMNSDLIVINDDDTLTFAGNKTILKSAIYDNDKESLRSQVTTILKGPESSEAMA